MINDNVDFKTESKKISNKRISNKIISLQHEYVISYYSMNTCYNKNIFCNVNTYFGFHNLNIKIFETKINKNSMESFIHHFIELLMGY